MKIIIISLLLFCIFISMEYSIVKASFKSVASSLRKMSLFGEKKASVEEKNLLEKHEVEGAHDNYIKNFNDIIQLSSVGDWGNQNVINSGVAKWSTENAKDGVLLLGDNFYQTGVSSADDPQFSLFEKGFQLQDVNNNHDTNYYIIVGNHDYYGKVSAQLDYAKTHSHWIFPSLYYSRTVTSKNGNLKVFIIATDTWGLNGGDTKLRFLHSHGDPDEEQYKWIEKELSSDAAKNADWVIVLGHFPLYSCANYGHSGDEELRKRLIPLLEKYKVDSYIYGHDHILQHIISNGVNHFGSGAGGKKYPDVNYKYKGLEKVIPNHYGYMEHEFTENTFKTTIYYSLNGIKTYGYQYTYNKKTK